MSAYELLYTMRALAETKITECDRLIEQAPAPALIYMRRHYARMAMRYHAKIERLEQRYVC